MAAGWPHPNAWWGPDTAYAAARGKFNDELRARFIAAGAEGGPPAGLAYAMAAVIAGVDYLNYYGDSTKLPFVIAGALEYAEKNKRYREEAYGGAKAA